MSKSNLSRGTVWDSNSLVPLSDIPPPEDVTDRERREYEAVIQSVGNNVPPPVQMEHDRGKPVLREDKQNPLDVVRNGASDAESAVLDSASQIGDSMAELRRAAADLCPHVDVNILNNLASTLRAFDSLNSVVGDALNLGDYNLLQVMIDCVQRLYGQASNIGMNMRMGFGNKVRGLAESGDVEGVLALGGMASVTNEYFDKSVTVKSLLGNMGQDDKSTGVMDDLLSNGAANVNRQSYIPSPDLHWITVSSDSFAYGAYGYFVDTTGLAVDVPLTITFPTNPGIDDKIGIVDYSRNAAVNNIVVNPNGHPIDWVAENYTITVSGAACEFVYRGTDQGWAMVVGPVLPEVKNYDMTATSVVTTRGSGGVDFGDVDVWDGQLLVDSSKNGSYLRGKLESEGAVTDPETVNDMVAILA